MLVTTEHGKVRGFVLKTYQSSRTGIYYSVVYTWPWSRTAHYETYLVVCHTRNWKDVTVISSRLRAGPALSHAKQMAEFSVRNNYKVLDQREDGLTLYGMWMSSMIFDSLVSRLDEGRYWVVVPHNPHQSAYMWKNVDSIDLGDVIAFKVDDLNEEEVGRSVASKKARVFLVEIIDGACFPRKG